MLLPKWFNKKKLILKKLLRSILLTNFTFQDFSDFDCRILCNFFSLQLLPQSPGLPRTLSIYMFVYMYLICVYVCIYHVYKNIWTCIYPNNTKQFIKLGFSVTSENILCARRFGNQGLGLKEAEDFRLHVGGENIQTDCSSRLILLYSEY
jgi:hypothetical protein